MSDKNPLALGSTYLISELRNELLIAREDVRAVLDQTAQRPEPQRRFSILLDDVQVRPVDTTAHLACFLYDRVDTLIEWVVQRRQYCLQCNVIHRLDVRSKVKLRTFPPRSTS